MPYAIDATNSVQRQVRAAARERLDLAIGVLEALETAESDEIERGVHEVRKRCKELRGLVRFVRAPIGSEYQRFDRLVSNAARELGALRDAHAVLATLDDLRVVRNREDDPALNAVREHQARAAEEATAAVGTGDERIRRAHDLLVTARGRVRRWDIPSGTRWLEEGLWTSYDRARRGLRRARRKPTDDRLHEWRKAVKTLWYQLRLVEGAAPSVLASLVTQLHDLAEALGDDHDLSVLTARLETDPKGFGGAKQVKRAVKQARAEQDDLRRRAFRLGTTLFTEPTDAFVHRVSAYWRAAIEAGPELATGGIAELVADEQRPPREPPTTESDPGHHLERERKFIVDTLPPLPDEGRELRQGYLAIDGTVSLRVREGGRSGRTLTVKAGRGAVRTELEWPITTDQFEAAWAHTETRRVHKTRSQIGLDDWQPGGASTTADVDVFHDELDGLVLVEVHFTSDETLSAFMPPAWFGREVTDDPAYTNASLAVNGWQSR